MKGLLFISAAVFCLMNNSTAQEKQKLWHGIERQVRYHPEGNDIVIENGTRRFNRALYGGNTAFRAEVGDLPEFALYMPGMGGNLKFGLVVNDKSKWLIECKKIKAIYRAGSMLYEIKDELLGDGVLRLHVIALYENEGMIVQLQTDNISTAVQLVAVYGGATGKKFSRDGDIGADPESSFFLKPEYCKDNLYKINKNNFTLLYGFAKPLSEEERYEVQHLPANANNSSAAADKGKELVGIFPETAVLKMADATKQQSPVVLLQSEVVAAPLITASLPLNNKQTYFFAIQKPEKKQALSYVALPKQFQQAEAARKKIADRIKVSTPDPFINTLGSVLGIAADGVWEDPSFMHGAVAWRMRLNGWRGAYVADVFGWHDRARKHFDGYALSQVKTPLTGPVVSDTALHLGRQQEKLGTSLFSSGYISRNPGGDLRAHHYDMNLVFIDQLLNHFNWTGDTAYVRQMWPLLVRHLDWEKRNFDVDDDGLYDSYAAIWASDALQYSGGGVTHSSAYNYRSNKVAAQLAKIIGEDGSKYEAEANKILNAINQQLWMKNKGWYAEYKDLLGNKLLHESAALWTIYHAIDEGITDPFQAYQSLQYVNHYIPHIPIIAKGLKDSSLYTLSTTNWQPYTWSLNNVALPELLHTALAFWLGGQKEEAYRLWKSSLMESMYLGASPGNIQQLSFYDAIRGELYRDFADPIGMAGRTLVEGLFGVLPDALNDRLVIKPGLPQHWNNASLTTPNIQFVFKRTRLTEEYLLQPTFGKQLKLQLIIPAYRDAVESLTVNGKPVQWKVVDSIIGTPSLQIDVAAAKSYVVVIKWEGEGFEKPDYKKTYNSSELVQVKLSKAIILNHYQPVEVLRNLVRASNIVTGNLNNAGVNSLYLQLKQGDFSWFEPLNFSLIEDEPFIETVTITPETKFETVDLTQQFNDAVTNIFKNEYLSPRPAVPTLQLPKQGIGNWAYPLTTANISDGGLRVKAGIKNEVRINNIPFKTTATEKKNIVFTSMWDNYPDSVVLPLSGAASHSYFLMAGSTNPMQSRMLNGTVVVNYTDGTSSVLELKNPENWWPIEQDYLIDGFAFTAGATKPTRVLLKTGDVMPSNYKYTGIKGFSNFGIDGGAATVLDLKLNPHKQLKSITLKTIANDVVIGLMSVTLVR
ncbi:DUF4450 domain-containing protein [Lacibacter sediminis]|uniref:DUF4450 domain-containing protein n=1 Tax=Lacibacter sediminis TaxID=2760713 RepID=A0A7G5XB30_9BACT|nr:DUF4450 domain-containing protein [Lacibacter sediminis]QNA42683.1 DUF4450 domain-containing protein [Lacibacter sediminis]